MRKLTILASVLAVSVLALPAAAAPFPSPVPLPVDFQPEGIAIGTGSTFYVGSLWDGDIYRGNLRSGAGDLFIDVSDRQALGMRVDEGRHMLFVAGGFTGHAYVYDTRTGKTLADFSLGTPGTTLVNDVALTRHAAYFTETFAPVIYKVPIAAHRSFGPAQAIPVTGPAGVVTDGFGLNGIDASPDGSILLVDHTDLGILATVDPATGHSVEVAITAGSLVPGTLDGLQLRGHTAWVVENFANTIAEVRLSADLSTGAVVQTISDPIQGADDRGDPRLQARSREQSVRPGLPATIGPGAPPGTEFNVVQLSMH